MSKFETYRSVDAHWLDVPTKYCCDIQKPNGDILAVVEFMGRNAVCAWRHDGTNRMGLTFLCPVVERNRQKYLKYHNRYSKIMTRTGWVF